MLSKIIKTSILLIMLLSIAATAQERKKIIIPEMVANLGFIEDRWIGLSGRDVEPKDLEKYKLDEIAGVIIVAISKDSPASNANLQEDDVILEYDNQKVMSIKSLKRMVLETPVGRKVPLKIMRNGKIMKSEVVVEKRSWEFEMPDVRKWIYKTYETDIDDEECPNCVEQQECITLGIELKSLSKQLRKFFNAPDNTGILISHVYENSIAEKSGLQAGDVIIKINDKQIIKPHQLHDELCQIDKNKRFNLSIIRDRKEIQINISP